jgi:hypothetical protein
MNCVEDTQFNETIDKIYDKIINDLASVAEQDARLEQIYCIYLKCPVQIKTLLVLGGLSNVQLPPGY